MPSIRLLVASAILAVTSSAVMADLAGDFNLIKQRLIDEEMANAGSVSPSAVASYMSSLNPDGSWPDINYDDTTGTVWEPRVALGRLDDMSLLYNLPSSTYYHSDTLRAKYLLALDYWYARDPQSSNSWWNEIGGQQMLKGSLLIMQDQMNPTELANSISYLRRGDIYTSSYSGGGANMVDLADITIARGVLESSAATLQDAFGAVGETLAIVTGDGVKADFSFHQHDRILYNGGYGLSFAQQSSRLASLPEGTSFAYNSAQKEVLAQYMLAGQQWMMRGSLDYSTQGRAVTRQGQQAPGSQLLEALSDVESLNTSRQYELQRMIDRINAGGNDPTNYLSGNRAFFRSDFMTHQRKGWYASVHMVSTRTHGSESGNGEGLKNYYMGDGVTFITRGTFGEYSSIFPAWDWRRLPGATIEQKTGALPLINWGSGSGGGSSFVGGVSDGSYGMSTMTYSRDGVSAKKSWFFFDKEFVALGADIQAPGAANAVYTSLNQSLVSGTVTVKDGAGQRTVASGTTANLTGAQWVFHDQTGYVFLANPGNVTVKNATQSGSWYDINNTYSSSTVNKSVFSLWVDHGAHAANGQYACVVVPGIAGTTDVNTYASALPVSVLQNDASIQAVRHNTLKIAQAAFRQAGPLTIAPGLTITPDQQVLVMLQERNFGVQVSVADPAGNPNSSSVMVVDLDVTRPLSGTGCFYDPGSGQSTLEFELPTLQYAGQTVTGAFDDPIAGPRAAAYEPQAETAALYHMDDSPGAVVIADQSGNGLDLLGSLTAFYDHLGPVGLRAAAAFAPGAGTAAKLPKRVLSSAELSEFSMNHFTIEAWIEDPNTALASEGIFEVGKTGSGKVQFGLEGAALVLKAPGLSFAGPIATGSLAWSADTWYHVAVTVDTGDPFTSADTVTVRFYQTPASNTSGLANLVGELTGTGELTPLASASGLMLGDRDNSDTSVFSGLLDEVRFSNQAMSDDQFNLVLPGPATYPLTVNSGSGDGDYFAGQVVAVAADAAPSGLVFDRWTGDTAGLASVTSASTTHTMPASEAAITATYRAPQSHALTVNSGTGSGTYLEGTVVAILANAAPSGYLFSVWTGDVATVANASSGSTTITMPARSAQVTATYLQVGVGMVSRFPFDVNASDVIGTNNGTFVGGASIVADAQRGNVLALDGTNDYVNLPLSGMAAGRSELTLAMWVRPTRWSGTDSLYDEAYNGYWQFSIYVDGWYTRDSSTGTTGSRSNDLAVPVVELNQWHHLAFVHSVSNHLKAIYHDGQLYSSSSTSVDALTSQRSYVRMCWPSDGTYFSGRMDEVQLYGRALNQAEIAVLAGQAYALTVNSGGGSGNYAAGAVVAIAANAPASGKAFDRWTGDTACVAASAQASTTVTMPASAVSVTATYASVYQLTVNSGAGSGNYAAGAVVAIAADAPASGKAFDRWTGDTALVAAPAQASTTVTMPAAAVSVTATFVSVYQLTVNSGTGDGQHPAGTVVAIQADAAPSGKEFSEWTGDVATVADVSVPATTITMPASDAEVTATYSVVVPPLPGDLNGDGFVGQGDLNIVLSQWGKGAPPHDPITDPRADANHDNFVGQGDLNIVLADWGKGTLP